jgi:hypothetical protein
MTSLPDLVCCAGLCWAVLGCAVRHRMTRLPDLLCAVQA